MELLTVHMNDEEAIADLTKQLKEVMTLDTVFVCIGTDRNIGDMLGPLVGTMLEENEDFDQTVFGTVEEPAHGLNIQSVINHVHKNYGDKNIIAIDACIGDIELVSRIRIKDTPIHPGKGVGKNIGAIGDYAIVGIVSNRTCDLSSIRFQYIQKMAKIISRSIINAHMQLKYEQLGGALWEAY